MSVSALPDAAEAVVSKGEFAKLIGVSPGRVSQMITEGKIGPDALEGEGRSAKVRVELARAQLRARTDLGQRLGNGIGTRLDGALPLVADAPLAVSEPQGAPRLAEADVQTPYRPPAPQAQALDPVAERLREIKLEKAERDARRERDEELAERGIYVRADHSRAALVGVAVTMLNVFEGGVADIAQELAERFELPQRDLSHALRQAFRGLRIKAAAAARQKAEQMPELIEDLAAQEADAEEG